MAFFLRLPFARKKKSLELASSALMLVSLDLYFALSFSTAVMPKKRALRSLCSFSSCGLSCLLSYTTLKMAIS
jgi:hypothetical protein